VLLDRIALSLGLDTKENEVSPVHCLRPDIYENLR
jgi:hypothetical protein